MSNLSGEDGFLGRTSPPIELEVTISQDLDDLGAQRFGGAGESHIARGICCARNRAKLTPAFINYSLTTYNHDILLKVVEMLYALNHKFDIQGTFGDENNVRVAVCCSERNISGISSH